MNSESLPIFDAEHAAFLQGGVSISAASSGARAIPSQARATGCRVAPGRLDVTLFISGTQGAELVADILAHGPIAVVFSQPSTHRTVQLKAPGASLHGLSAEDLRIVDAYREAFVQECAPLGHDPAMLHAMLACPPEDLVAILFRPTVAFSQTPGPNAGEPLRLRT